ncbi:probable methyltransferase PMT27 [Rhodamnia argentea]|uniref:Probable methyltransferase PMT27 n=1 Tax=Rhodamnia argentea TaxID=178133 RepID=A0A8B8NPE6_9MYRT|nr:probable methyltransferase PMT27 [Rhodamnia argentea]
MAPGRSSRGNKRSSYTSYTSTITTIVFVTLCIVGVWMLTSDSFVPPQTTTKRSSSSTTTTATTTTNDDFSSSSSSVKTNEKKDTSSYEDNPGDLPDDAIKSDVSHQSDSNNNNVNNNANDNNDGANGSSQENQTNENDADKGASSTDDKQGLQDQENGGNDVKNDGVNSENNHGDAAGLSTQGLHGKESGEEHEQQNENENQVSEGSTGTQNQQSEENNEQGNDEQQQQQSNEDTSGNQEQEMAASSQNGSNSQEGENKYTDEDQQQEKQKQGNQAEHNDSLQGQSSEGNESGPGDNYKGSQSDANEDQKPQQENDAATQEQPQKQMLDIDKQKRIEEQQRLRAEDESTSQSQQQSQEEAQRPEETAYQRRERVEATSPAQQEHDEMQVQSNTHQDAQQNEELHKTDGSFPSGESSGIPKESKESKRSWSTQATQSENQKERRGQGGTGGNDSIYGYTWQLCNVTAGPDYIPCLDNEKALRQLHSTKHFEHRERHCPEDAPTCLVPVPEGYKKSIEWPKSREKIWYYNVPHKTLADVKGHQNWVKVTGEFLTFPRGGTQFIHGALHYIDFLQISVPNIKWGKHTRVILDVGCGVASFGGYLFEREVLTMSFAPKDEHEAQVQFALERGIPAISAVMGSQRLPFPSRVFDLVHCARCRVPWHAEGGLLLLELNRVLRPGGFFVWSATPVYQTLEEDVQIWKEMSSLTANMCWELVTIQKDKLNSIGAAIYRKPRSNDCYEQRKHHSPPMCKNDDDPNAAWYVPLQACMHQIPVNEAERGTRWPVVWPRRMRMPPYWLNSSQIGIYGKPAPQDFSADYEHWKRVVSGSYMSGLGISWSGVRNVMDMRAVYGGFAAALKDLQMWVLNVVNVDSPDTLPIIYERGLFGIYHDWCESFSTYPRTYDLLHADHLFSKLRKRCKLPPVMAEVDRIVRPGGKIIVRDESDAIGEIENLLKSLHWEVHLTFSKDKEGILSAQKGEWRPSTYTATS